MPSEAQSFDVSQFKIDDWQRKKENSKSHSLYTMSQSICVEGVKRHTHFLWLGFHCLPQKTMQFSEFKNT